MRSLHKAKAATLAVHHPRQVMGLLSIHRVLASSRRGLLARSRPFVGGADLRPPLSPPESIPPFPFLHTPQEYMTEDYNHEPGLLRPIGILIQDWKEMSEQQRTHLISAHRKSPGLEPRPGYLI